MPQPSFTRAVSLTAALSRPVTARSPPKSRATLPGLDHAPERAARIASYMRRAQAALDALPSVELLAGRVTFPLPDVMDRNLKTEHAE